MVTPCTIAPEAAKRIRRALRLPDDSMFESVHLEFREVPYFIVSRSRENWDAERGDINTVHLVDVTKRGLIADPDGSGQGRRLTLIPWTNVISLTAERA